MAIGVPETEVFAAADAVLARGERPTVERVRQELGRGSPARVGSLLDRWWTGLAMRLSGETRLPTLPAEVSKAFVAAWQQAIHFAQGVAEQNLSEQRQVVAAERERVAEIEDQARLESATYRQHATEASAARQAIETRLSDLELLLEQRRLQIDDLQQQREALLDERNQAQQQGQLLQMQLQSLQARAEQERGSQEAYARGVEERAHREIDRAREESKRNVAELKAVSRQLEQLQRRLESTQVELSQAEQRAAAQMARSDTLEQQLTQLREQSPLKRKPRVRKASKD